MKIKDSIIIITGASEGIGRATAEYLSKNGAKVVLAARSHDKLSQVASGLHSPDDSLVVETDMRKPEQIKRLIDQTIKKYGRIDILINNAGQGAHGPVEKIDIEDFKKIMDLNIYSVVEAMQAVIPQMRKQGGGMIVNISSMLSKMYIPGLAAYASTKHALNAISLTARQELAKDKIVVSLVLPSLTDTRFGQNALGQRSEWLRSSAPMKADPAEKVAMKIGEAILSEATETALRNI